MLGRMLYTAPNTPCIMRLTKLSIKVEFVLVPLKTPVGMTRFTVFRRGTFQEPLVIGLVRNFGNEKRRF
tara:strand:+ start:51 stop:257 length:207 start_codon:yes stop_codon:yes gene_type:complete